jgi:thiosulfate/3-mercaptopyruvate sulfurtransferase
MKKFGNNILIYSITSLLFVINIFGTGCGILYKDYIIPISDRGYSNPNCLISPAELKNMNDVILINSSRNKAAFIPGSIWFDLKKVLKKINNREIYVPEKEKIEDVFSEAGFSENKSIVIYDSVSIARAARLWWTLKLYGHKDVRLLDGGFTAWINAGYDSVSIQGKLPKSTYHAKEFDKSLYADSNSIKDALGKRDVLIIDARSLKEFEDGHIPGAIHIEWSENINKNKTFKTAEQLKSLYESKGITKDKEIIAYCGSGTRSSVALFVLKELLGYQKVMDYNGSWMEYSSLNLPKEK